MDKKRNAKKELQQLSEENLRGAFENLMNTQYMFWNLYFEVRKKYPEFGTKYLIDKLLNDCSEKDILEETQQWL